ncbi:MAG: hypothetical protein WC076_07975 [Terrimicrobiaceae bacterium]|nr:hypothetical protein [Terrimicrobiaceae bacterium]
MGKIDKLRDCPAVGRRIKPVECGQNRGKNYACPPECPHCPWAVANYDTLLDIEGAIDSKTLGFYIDVVGKDSARERLRLDTADGSEEGELVFQSACYHEFFYREIQPGKRLFDLWREAGWKGLTRDEPFLAGFKANVRPVLLEVRRVVDDLRVECVDLLDESAGVFVVCDQGMAKGALQFQCLMGWVAAYPFFSRMHGAAYTLPQGDEPGLDLVRRHVRKLGGPKAGPLPGWLFENFHALHGSIMEECQKSMKAMFRNTDFKECVAVYRLRDRLVTLMKGHLQTMDGHSKKDGRRYDIGWVLDELGLGEMKAPARAVPTASAAGWWEELDEREFAARLQAGIADPEGTLSIDHFPVLAGYFDTIDASLLNTKEHDALILMINLAIATVIPEGIAPEDIEEAEMIRETEAVFELIIPRVATDVEFVVPIGRLIEISAQPAILSFAATFLMSLTKKGKIAGLVPFGKRVRVVSIVPMLVQIEAFLRCLRRSSLG